MNISSLGEINTYTKMRQFTKYIFLLLCLLTACHRMEFEEPSLSPDVPDVSGEARIKLSVSLPGGMAQTKAMGESPVTDIKNLYLIVFDSNGYYIESRQAEIGVRDNNTAEYEVTLTMTNQKRIIHFIANCPIDQVEYGHENEVISKLYVTKAQNESQIETAYWHRKEVPYIIANEAGQLLNDQLQVLTEDANPFYNVPLLRNYTQITVEDNDDDDDNFHLLSYAIYNTIDIGTVAPYNKSKLKFQDFGENGHLFSYDRLLSDGFEGHALAEAELNTDLTEDDFMDPGTPYYMYERKISVRAGSTDESQWDESPTHIILKGIYTGEGFEENTTPSYYKVDIIREVNNTSQYYNLLRNFDYTFKLKSVAGAGYDTWEKAMQNPAGNNLAGSTHTQDLTDVSDGTGRIMVSFTDTTLVSNHDIKFKFRYIPDIHNPVAANREVSIKGDLDGSGTVLKGLKYTINYEGTDGWAEVVFRVNDPTNVTQEQEIVLNAGNNINLQKTIRFKLMKPYSMDVICYDRTHQNQTFEHPDNVIPEGIGQQLGVYIRIPDDLTPDMFPLEFKVEADKLSISPDVSNGNTVPVVSGQSIIPGKPDPSFHYLFSIDTYDLYQSLLYDEQSDTKVVISRWLTNLVKSASYVVVDNKYFNIAASYFRNSEEQTEQTVLGHKRRFTDLRVDPNPVFYGKDIPVKIMFDLDSREQNFLPKTVHVNLEGMVCTKHGDTDFDVYLTENAKSDPNISNLDPHTKVVEMQPGSRSVIVDGLKTTVVDHSNTENEAAMTGPIRFTLSTPEFDDNDTKGYYTMSSDVATRIEPAFTMLMIEPNPVLTGENIPVSIRFYMDADDEDYFNRDLTIHLDGLKTAHRGLTTFDVRPAEGSIKIMIDSLVTSTVNGNVSFTVVDNGGKYNAESGKSKVATRENADFWGLTINPSKVAQGVGKKLSISFNMDEDDKNFATREITVTLTGMKYVHPQTKKELTELVFTPSTRYMTIGDLVTTSNAGEVSFTVSTSGYDDATARAQRSEVEFKNLSFTRDGNVVTRINEGETVDFNFTMSYYEEGMTVDVTLDGFEPYDMPASGDGSLVPAATRAATSYVFTPFERNCKLKLKAINTTSSSYSVGLAAASYGFTDASKGISKAIYQFNATPSTKNITSKNDVVTISFTIPANAWEAGQTTMPVKVTLGRLIPADNKLSGSNGSYVYNVTKNANSSTLYSFTVKPSEDGPGVCTVKLDADYFMSETIPDIVQTVTHALMFKNTTSNSNVYDSQAVYQLDDNNQLRNGQAYTLTFYVKADKQIGQDQFSIFLKQTGNDNQQQQFDNQGPVTTEWTKKTITINANNNYNMIAFNTGRVGIDNAIYFDKVSLVPNNGTNVIVNSDFEETSNIATTNQNTVGPANTWWRKTNTGANPQPQCSMSIVTPGCTLQ